MANSFRKVVEVVKRGRQGVVGAPGVSYLTRAEAQATAIPAHIMALSIIHNGMVLDYQRDAAGTALTTAGGAKWSPAGISYPDHFGAVGDGVADDHPELVLWAAHGGEMAARAGSVFTAPTFAGAIRFPAGARADWGNAIYRSSYTIAGNTAVMNIEAGAEVRNLRWEFPDGHYVERAVVLQQGASVSGWRVSADDAFPTTGDVRDALLSIRGTDVVIEDMDFDGPARPINFYQDTDGSRARISNIHLRRYVQGIGMRGMADGSVIDGVYVHSISPFAAGDPGHNVITEGGNYVIVRNVYQMFPGRGSGEHFGYCSVTDGTLGMVLDAIHSHGSGQSFIKMRGHDGASITNCSGGPTAEGTSPGTNEDGLRMEHCRNMRIEGLAVRASALKPAGYDGIHLNNCWSIRGSNITLGRPVRAYIYLCTPPALEGFTAPPDGAVTDIIINGITATGGGGKPFILCGDSDSAGETTVRVGNITIDNLIWDGDPADLFRVKAGMTLVRTTGTTIRIRGLVSGQRVEYTWAAAAGSPTLVVG